MAGVVGVLTQRELAGMEIRLLLAHLKEITEVIAVQVLPTEQEVVVVRLP